MKKKLAVISFMIFVILIQIPQLIKGAELESGDYAITDNQISRINPGTTIGDFKTNLNASSLKVYKNTNKTQEVTSGNVGTNMCAEHEGKTRKLSVIGDLNEDGNANQLDLSLMIRHILGFRDGQITDDMKKLSADITGDNNINNVDITALIRYNIFGEFFITVSAPEITNMAVTTATNSVTISVTADNAENGIYQYSYKESGAASYTEAAKTKDNSYTITGLKENTKYTVMARVTNKYGMADKEEKEVTTVKQADTTKPTITEVSSSSSTTSISLTIRANDTGSGLTGKYTFYIKETSASDSTYQKVQDSSSTTMKKEQLKENTSYTVKVEVSDKEGNVATYTKVISTQQMQDSINQSSLTWNNGKATLILTTNSGHTIEYQVNGTSGTWNKGGTIANLNNGDTVYARLTDGTNYGNTKQFNVSDTTPPTIREITSSTTMDSLAIQITASDNESGISASTNYTFYVKQTSQPDSSYIKEQETTSTSFTKSGLLDGQSYTVKVEVRDNAGNIGTYTKVLVTTGVTMPGATNGLTTGSIIATAPVWNNGTASLTLSTATEYTIEWQINSITGTWTRSSTVTGINHNDTVYARLTNGTKAGQEGSITVQDKEIPEDATISINDTTVFTGDTLTATVTLVDNQNGPDVSNCKWVCNTDATAEIDETLYTGTFSTASQTLTLPTTAEGTYYLHVLTVDKAGNKKQTVSTAITISKTTADSVKPGDYVAYTGGNYSNWRVMTTKDSSEGIQLISKGVTKNITLGSDESGEAAIEAYNNGITILNDAAQEYINETYAESARCVGSIPYAPNSESGYYTSTSSDFTSVDGKLKNLDDNFGSDTTVLYEIDPFEMLCVGTPYWLASRYVDFSYSGNYTYLNFKFRNIYSSHPDAYYADYDYATAYSTSVISYEKYNYGSSVSMSNKSNAAGFRPIVKLKSGIKITAGSGTVSDPWRISI